MPARRTSKAAPLTLGFAGMGELDKKAIDALLDDLMPDNVEVANVYIPVTEESYTDAIAAVVAWLKKYDIPYISLSDDEALKDRTLKKVIEAAADDYAFDGSDNVWQAVVELLEGSEDEPVEDGRLIMFFDADSDPDVDTWEFAEDKGVKSFDMLDALQEIVAEAGGDQEPEPPAEEKPTRGRGRKASAEDEEPETPRRGRGRSAPADEPDGSDEEETKGGDYSAPEKRRHTNLMKLGLTELKAKLKGIDKTVTTADLKGTDKEFVADSIILAERAAKAAAEGGGDEEPGDEAQQPTGRGRRGAVKAAEPGDEPADDPDGAEDPKEAVFARLRGNREAAELISRNLTRSLKAITDEGEPEEVIERAAAAVAASLMLFAEVIITEVRKPKSAGRPRKDGTEAQPAKPVDPDAPRRGRGRPRKSD